MQYRAEEAVHVPVVPLRNTKRCTSPFGNVSTGGYAIAVPNSQETLRLPESSVETFVFDPTKGRNFRVAAAGGNILMSPYTRSKVETTDFVVPIEYQGFHLVTAHLYRPTTPQSCCFVHEDRLTSRWNRNVSFDTRYHNFTGGGYEVFPSNEAEVDEMSRSMVGATQAQALSDANSAFDLLTELAELRETVSFFGGAYQKAVMAVSELRDRDPEAFERAKQYNLDQLAKSADKAFRRIAGGWLALRYAIMPLYYSANDIREIVNSYGVVYDTARSSRDEQLSFSSYPLTSVPDRLIFETITGSLLVRSTVKSAYTVGALQRLLATIGMNPFATAYEMIPLSFVVDWFFRVGDTIRSFTSPDLSSQRKGCTSVKLVKSVEWWVHDKSVTNYSRTVDLSSCGIRTWSASHARNTEAVIRQSITTSYQRTLFELPPAVPSFDVYLDWKRTLDGIALSYNRLSPILRRL